MEGEKKQLIDNEVKDKGEEEASEKNDKENENRVTEDTCQICMTEFTDNDKVR